MPRSTRIIAWPLAWLLASAVLPAQAAAQPAPAERESASLSADQLLTLADMAAKTGDLEVAEQAYRALFQDSSVQVRSEARFRLAMIFVGRKRYSDAAILLRQILDEEPHAQRVRLELARTLDLIGDEAGARRALREAQAGELPQEVARFVDRYSAALRARKPLGASLDIALAPDSNINRATRSQTLGTVIGDFVLDEDAREQSGVGLSLRGQAYARLPLGPKANLIGRVSGAADIYRNGDFNDIALAVSAGPELQLGADRLALEPGVLWRRYGGSAYSRSATLGLTYYHAIGRRSQLRGTANLALVDSAVNRQLDGQTYSGSLSYERALSSRAGAGLTLSADRQALRDPGYAGWSGQASLFAYREFGSTTLVATVAHGRLWADRRLLIYPARRSDRLYRASLGATFRRLRLGTFAPFVRATLQRNRSSAEIYDYRRFRTEFGITRSF